MTAIERINKALGRISSMRTGSSSSGLIASEIYAPPDTLGAPEGAKIAMDAQLHETGVYSLLQHALDMGQVPGSQFLGYAALQSLTQNGLIRACIETVADDMTREWIELRNDTDDKTEDSETVTQLDKEMDKYHLQDVFHEAASLCGYEGGALIFIDTGVYGPDLLTPLSVSSTSAELTPGSLKGFKVIDPAYCFPGTYNSINPLAPNYYKPSTWHIQGQQVHASRLIRVVANEVPILLKPAYNFFGLAQAQILYDYVLHFQQCRDAANQLLTKFSTTVVKMQLKDTLYAGGGTTQLDMRLNYFIKNRDNMGVVAIDNDTEDMVKLETPLSGVEQIVRQSLEFLAALNRTPAVKLLGISPSGFNATGESDIKNYYDHVRSQQEKVLRHGISKCLKVLQLNLNGMIDESVTFEFKRLNEEDKVKVTSTQNTKAQTLGVLLDRGVISAEEARGVLSADSDSGFTGIDADAVPEDDGAEMTEMLGSVPPAEPSIGGASG